MARPLRVEYPGAFYNVSYAGYFNRKRQRRGHLFQGRFKSILVDADEYLKHLSHYIHLSKQIQSNHKLRRRIKRIKNRIINN